MAKFYDISNWQKKPHFNTGGTRNKAVFENPETGELYYFKTSLKREGRDYKHEFWSEILASEIGKELGFDTLKYDIAFDGTELGCLSKSMVDTNVNKLSEGINYLQGYEPNYNPYDKKSRPQYTFHFIERALNEYRLKDRMNHLVEVIIFDSLIGNGDRHQENWGFIIPNLQQQDGNTENFKNKLLDSNLFRFIFRHFLNRKKMKQDELDIAMDFMKGVFSPIYDSGSCLGRELENEKVDMMSNDNTMVEAYFNRDRCEIHWKDEKLSHFDLIKHLKEETNYRQVVDDVIKRVIQRFNNKKIEKIIKELDNELPEKFFHHKLPDNRKILIGKFVSLRFERLKQVLQ
jgi:hypothetical protein